MGYNYVTSRGARALSDAGGGCAAILIILLVIASSALPLCVSGSLFGPLVLSFTSRLLGLGPTFGPTSYSRGFLVAVLRPRLTARSKDFGPSPFKGARQDSSCLTTLKYNS
jgi:hypothetical protein